MSQINCIYSIPHNSIISKNFDEYHYFDSFSISVITDKNIDQITNKVFSTPNWVNFLLKIRNGLVKVFGLKTGNKNSLSEFDHYNKGEKTAVFTVIDRNDKEIILGESDKHLNFRVSVLLNNNETEKEIFVTTIVKFNNFLGRLYFLPVKPFHKLIVKSLLKRLINNEK